MSKSIIFIFLTALLTCFGFYSKLLAAEYVRTGDIVGKRSTYRILGDESLPEIARQFDLGFTAITAANPTQDPFIPDPRHIVNLPTEWILPDTTLKKGVLINIAEMRLYLLDKRSKHKITSFPIGIGDQGKDTPVGVFKIIEKIKAPAWHVPKSILAEKPFLPAVMPPGPDNPMGSHALRLSNQTVLIHGTDRPWGIGTRDSHGCIRLYQEDIAQLFKLVARGTPVTIVNQPVKAAVRDSAVYLQVNDNEDGQDLYQEAINLLEKKKLLDKVDLLKVKAVTLERSGLLTSVNR